MLPTWNDCIHTLLIQHGKIWKQRNYYINLQHKVYLNMQDTRLLLISL